MSLSDEEVMAAPPGMPDEEVMIPAERSPATERPVAPKHTVPEEIAHVMSTVNEKHIAAMLGLPVDLVNKGLEKIGLPVSDQPLGGSKSIKSGMRALGMSDEEAKPDTTAGRIAAETLGAVATAPAGGGVLGGAMKLAAPLAGPSVGAALKTAAPVMAAPIPNIAAGATGGLGGAAGEELFRDTKGKDIAKLVGELAGGAASGFIPGVSMRSVALRPASTPDAVVAAYERLGLVPSAAERAQPGTAGRIVGWAEGNTLPQSIGGSGVMDRFQQERRQAITNLQEDIAAAYGTPKPRPEMGSELQNAVVSRWTTAKENSGKVIGEIRDKYAEETVYPQKLIDAIVNPVGGAKTGPVREATLDPLMAEAAALIRETGGHMTMADLAALKTKYGYASEPGFHKNVNDAQVDQLHAAVKADFENSVKAKSPEDYARLKTANGEYATAMTEFKQNFKKLLGTKDVPVSAERAFEIVTGAAGEKGRGDIKEFTTVWNALPKETQGNLTATILTRLGSVDKSVPNNPESFSLGKFVSGYRDLSQEAKDLLFKNNPKQAQALDDLAAVSSNLQEKILRFASTSRSGAGAMQIAQLGGAGAMLATGNIPGALLAIGGPWVAAHMLTNPTSVKVLTKTLQGLNDSFDSSVRAGLALNALPKMGDSLNPPAGIKRPPSLIEKRSIVMPEMPQELAQ